MKARRLHGQARADLHVAQARQRAPPAPYRTRRAGRARRRSRATCRVAPAPRLHPRRCAWPEHWRLVSASVACALRARGEHYSNSGGSSKRKETTDSTDGTDHAGAIRAVRAIRGQDLRYRAPTRRAHEGVRRQGRGGHRRSERHRARARASFRGGGDAGRARRHRGGGARPTRRARSARRAPRRWRCATDVSKAADVEALAAQARSSVRRRARRLQQRRRGGRPGLRWTQTRGRLGVGARREPVGRDPRRARRSCRSCWRRAARRTSSTPRRSPGSRVRPASAIYNVSKHGVVALSETLHHELAMTGSPVKRVGAVSRLRRHAHSRLGAQPPGGARRRCAGARGERGGRRKRCVSSSPPASAPAQVADARLRSHPRRALLRAAECGVARSDPCAHGGHRRRTEPRRARRAGVHQPRHATAIR